MVQLYLSNKVLDVIISLGRRHVDESLENGNFQKVHFDDIKGKGQDYDGEDNVFI